MVSSLLLRNAGVFLTSSSLIALVESSGVTNLLENVTSFGFHTVQGKINYTRDAYWHGESFFENFEFMTSEQYIQPPISSPDPTHGFVNYVDEDTATNTSLISITKDGNPRWGVDTSNTYTPGKDWGRPSIRIESKKSWTHGLFLFDIAHMPGASCGIWPALWSLGSGEWPYNGEIDILEGVHLNTNNQVVIHTGDNCTLVTPPGSALAPVSDPLEKASINGMPAGNCAEEYSSSGCRAQATTPKNYGDPFNANGGGIYAMQWTSSFIKLWFFPRDEVDQKIQDVIGMDPNSVDVSAFGLPETTFAGGRGCDVDEHFKEHRIIFDTTFCGDWGGNSWPSRCPSVAGKKRKESCEIYVGAHPEKYKETYWEINSIMVFKEDT